jgi:hypothetical protein
MDERSGNQQGIIVLAARFRYRFALLPVKQKLITAIFFISCSLIGSNPHMLDIQSK